jgi:acetyl-CoA carboxylase biotin carboxyl carrier protein
MKIEEIKELVRLMVENDLAELDITEGENKIRLRRSGGGEVTLGGPGQAPMLVPAPAPPATAAAPAPGAAAAAEDLLEIRSPMVGTFYAAASPDSEPYVSLGSRVEEDTVVCILEAMKVMNEIKAECVGAVAEVCVRNVQPVEYGQVLFRVRPF